MHRQGQNRIREIRPSGIAGGPGETWPWLNGEPTPQPKGRSWKRPNVGAPQLYPDPTGKENSESILASSLAGDTARCHLKRRQRYRWAGLLSFEKPKEQDADSVPRGGRQHSNHANREWIARSCVV